MKKLVAIFIFMSVLTGVFAGCSSGKSTSGESASTTNVAPESEVVSDGQIANESVSSESAEIPSKNGFNSKTNEKIVVAGVQFQLPNYYLSADAGEKSGKSGGNSSYYAIKNGEDIEGLAMAFEGKIDTTSATFEANSSIVDDQIIGLIMSDTVIDDVWDGDVAGLPGRYYEVSGKLGDGRIAHAYYRAFFNEGLHSLGIFGVFEIEDTAYDYSSDYKSILDSAELVEGGRSADANGKPEKSSIGASENASSTVDDGGVSPDLKEALDSYEAFMDEYVEFMRRYQESDDTMSMLSEYSTYLQKYADFTSKIEDLDTSNMSAADYAYYVEVTTRVSKRLLEVL